jgi:hypothetical protein
MRRDPLAPTLSPADWGKGSGGAAGKRPPHPDPLPRGRERGDKAPTGERGFAQLSGRTPRAV